jgi:lipoyl synthase
MNKETTHLKKPEWLKTPIPTGQVFFKIRKDLREKNLFTVCEEAKCPNISECWSSNTATFMILGDTCTRACRFCHVKTGNPGGWLDHEEADKTALSVATMGLKYVVITMVDRDDLADGGAKHVAAVLTTVREKNPGIIIELLAGDFQANTSAWQTLAENCPDVYAHNVETVPRLSPRVRDARAGFDQSLKALHWFKEHTTARTKSALMLGLGETLDEVKEAMQRLRDVGVDMLTIGQYMRPTKKHLSVKRFVHPDEFKELEIYGYSLGFVGIASGPLVRSSYRAREFYERCYTPRESQNFASHA